MTNTIRISNRRHRNTNTYSLANSIKELYRLDTLPVIFYKMQKSPLERWVENLPSHIPNSTSPKINDSISNNKSLSRDYSFHSDDGASLCSSVESFLELRKPDPEEVLMELGFGPSKKSEKINRIPERFLQPSKLLPHIDVNKFLEEREGNNPETNSCPATPSRTRPRSN